MMKSLKWNSLKRFLIYSILFSSILFPFTSYSADHVVDYWQNIPCVLWTRGCTPTSASMVLGIWDPTDWDTGYLGMGRLTDYWRELSRYSDGTGDLRNVPNVLEELRIAMGTNVAGNTNTNNIRSGISSVTNSINGYNFSTGQTECTYSSWWFDNDWCWDTGINGIRDEINAGRPFVWSVGIDDEVGHSLAAWGYTDSKYVITFNTWNCPGRDDWYYSEYDNGTGIDWGYVDRVVPGGWTWGSTDLTIPNGGETWYIGGTYTIQWWEEDSRTWSADLFYSIDGGVNWTRFKLVEPSSPGWMSTTWTIPTSIAPTTKARIKIENFSGSASAGWVYQSGDGSKSNFTLAACPTPATPSVLSPANGATCVSTTPLLDWSDVSGATSYEVQVCTNSGCTSVARSATPTASSWTVSPALSNNTQYWWRARARNACGSWSAWGTIWSFTTTFTPATPTLSSPANGATGVSTTPLLDWTDAAGATSYDVQVCSDSGCASVVRSANPTTSQWTVSPALSTGVTYYWRARSNACGNNSAWTGIRSFTTVCPVPATPTLSSPANGATGVSTTPLLDWTDAAGATSYDVQVCSDSGCASVVRSANPTTSQWTVSPVLSTGVTYYWRARANNACGNGSWTGTWSFTTVCPVPATPSLVSPANGATGVSTTPLLDWTDAAGATSYDVQVCSDSGCASVVRSANPTTSQWTASPALSTRVAYYWRARANNACGSGLWSSTWSFRTVGKSGMVDFDGDGKTDIAVYRTSTGAWYIKPSGGGSPYGAGWGGDATDKPAPGDYDGDGKTDLAVYRISTGAWYIKPSGGGTSYGVGWGGDATDKPAPGDYDGDGKTDIAVYRSSTGAWYVYPSGGGSPYGVGWGGDATDKPAPGDYDGDGKTDIAVYRTSTGAWYVRPSGGASPYGVGWGGNASDKPVPGDYDGDRKTDIAVYRAATGAWYVYPSGGGAPYGVGWGGDATDKPAPGDYDGDGKTDIAVYRTSTGAWYV